jgi:hypothetical protein
MIIRHNSKNPWRRASLHRFGMLQKIELKPGVSKTMESGESWKVGITSMLPERLEPEAPQVLTGLKFQLKAEKLSKKLDPYPPPTSIRQEV